MPLFNDATQQIITSASEPSNKYSGLIWNELNASGNLVESWTRISNSWFSAIKEINFTTGSISTNATYYFPLDTTKDIYFLSYSRFFLSGGVSVTNSFGVICAAYSDDTALASPPNNLFLLNYASQTNGQVITGTGILNKNFAGLNATNLRVQITRSGSPPACSFGFAIRYQYIRK